MYITCNQENVSYGSDFSANPVYRLAMPAQLGAGTGEYRLVFAWLRHRRSRHDPVLSGDRHSLAGDGHHDAGHHQWIADIDCAGNRDPVAADAAAAGAEDGGRHVADLDDCHGSRDEYHRCGLYRRSDPHLVGCAADAAGWLPSAASLQLLAAEGAWQGVSLIEGGAE